jgi:hypothetical protein
METTMPSDPSLRTPSPRRRVKTRLVLAAAGALALGGFAAASALTDDSQPDTVSVDLAGSSNPSSSRSSATDASSSSKPTVVRVPLTTDDSAPDDSTPDSRPDDDTSTSTPVTTPDDDGATSTSTPVTTPDDDDDVDDDGGGAVAPFTKTFTLVGGTAVISFDGSALHVVSATPNAGFDTEIEAESGREVDVRFEGNGHESRLKLELEDGRIEERTEERPDSSGSGSGHDGSDDNSGPGGGDSSGSGGSGSGHSGGSDDD